MKLSKSMSEAFESLENTHPFKIYVYPKQKKFSVEKLSLLLDTYSDREVTISKLGQSIGYQGSPNYVILECQISNNLSISSATISVTNSATNLGVKYDCTTPGSTTCTKAISIRKVIGNFTISSDDKPPTINNTISNNIRTVFNCGIYKQVTIDGSQTLVPRPSILDLIEM